MFQMAVRFVLNILTPVYKIFIVFLFSKLDWPDFISSFIKCFIF